MDMGRECPILGGMRYCSTRSDAAPIGFSDVLMRGLAPDGGLYVPETWPALTRPAQGAGYIETAFSVLAPFCAPDLNQPTLLTLLEDTYTPRTDGFSTPLVAPLRRLDDRLSVLELFHGPTLAFKDVALQLLGRLFGHNLATTGKKITILGATSGDTGSAAIEGCRHAAGAEIFILYPHNRPSEVQRRQMTTVDAPNVHAIAIEGDFDDCQAIVKTLFADAGFRARRNLSAVNSINWARIAAQIVYYVHAAYAHARPVNVIVPTGNFGNIYAAYAAKKMGAPIARLVVASNRNDILPRVIETGRMERRPVEPSLSPSMDIQISSNFERLIFDLLDRDPAASALAMGDFTRAGVLALPDHACEILRENFAGMRCDDAQTLAAITAAKRDYDYLIDPHTATAFHAWNGLKNELEGPCVALACAHPAKFPDAVERATGIRPALPHAMADLLDRRERFTVLPADSDAVRGFIEKNTGFA